MSDESQTAPELKLFKARVGGKTVEVYGTDEQDAARSAQIWADIAGLQGELTVVTSEE